MYMWNIEKKDKELCQFYDDVLKDDMLSQLGISLQFSFPGNAQILVQTYLHYRKDLLK